MNGKRDAFNRNAFYSLTKLSPMFSKQWIDRLLDNVIDFVSDWPKLAREHDVPNSLISETEQNLRLSL